MVIAPPTSNVSSIIDISEGQGPPNGSQEQLQPVSKMFGPQHLGTGLWLILRVVPYGTVLQVI